MPRAVVGEGGEMDRAHTSDLVYAFAPAESKRGTANEYYTRFLRHRTSSSRCVGIIDLPVDKSVKRTTSGEQPSVTEAEKSACSWALVLLCMKKTNNIHDNTRFIRDKNWFISIGIRSDLIVSLTKLDQRFSS